MPDIKKTTNVEFQIGKLASLDPEAQARVADVLKDALEKELAAGTVKTPIGGENAAFDKQAHDRGPLFGKDSFDKQSDTARHLQDMLELGALDEATFKTFTDRLRALKEIGPNR